MLMGLMGMRNLCCSPVRVCRRGLAWVEPVSLGEGGVLWGCGCAFCRLGFNEHRTCYMGPSREWVRAQAKSCVCGVVEGGGRKQSLTPVAVNPAGLNPPAAKDMPMDAGRAMVRRVLQEITCAADAAENELAAPAAAAAACLLPALRAIPVCGCARGECT